MAVFETWLDQDLKKPVRIQYLSGNLFSQDNMGNLIGVNVTDDGAPATLGGSVSANVIRADGATVAVDSGVLSGNKASVTLPQAAYAVPGVITVVIKITSGTDVTTLAAVVTTVYRSSTDTIVDPGTIIPSIQTLISQIETAVASIPSDYSSLWTTLAPAYSTSATYAVGQYVTYNGGLYRCTTAITSAESWTAAHWTAAKVGNDLSDLKSALFMATGNDAIFMSDGYLGLTGSTPIDPTSPTITQNYKHAFIECSPGDLFTVSAAGGATPRAWGFLDSDKIPMEEKETANVRIIDKLIEAPTGAAYFVINNKENGLHSYIGKSMKKTEDARYELVSNAINIRSDRSDFTINKYYRIGQQEIAALNGWMCTHKYAALAGKEYTLVHDLTDPVKSIYAIAYDADDTYLDYKRINYSNSIIIDDLLSTYKKAKYIALDFDVSDQIATLTSEDVASWYLEVSDVSKAVHDNLVDATSKNITVDGNNLATTSLTWGYKFLKPISAFIWKPIFNSNNSKLITCNIYKKDNEHTPYYDGNQRNDYITLSESFKVLKDGFIILRDIEPDTYIEVVSTGDTINYRDPDSTTEKLDNQFLEMGNYKTVDDDRIFNTNESSYNKSFLSGEYFYVLKNPVLSVLKGKKIACIGDSITEHNFRAWVNWVMYLESWTGCKIQNLGQSGRGFVNDYAATSYIDKIALITGTPDMIGVACSFNDVYTGKGQTIDWTTENGRTAGKVYIDDFWDALLTAYPTVPFICFCEGPWYNARPGIAASDGYISTVKKSCNEHGVPFYDGLYYGTALRPWIQANKEVYFVSDNPQELPMGTVDNTHPNSKGHKFIARYLVNKFSENIYSDGLDYR